jgi:hypothetical protein
MNTLRSKVKTPYNIGYILPKTGEGLVIGQEELPGKRDGPL